MTHQTLKNTALTLAAVIAIGLPGNLLAANIKVASSVPVDQAVSQLTEAVAKAGARVFTTVDFTKGAASQGVELRPTTVVIFGSPKIGAPALLIGQTMGLFLPLRVLAYEDALGKTWLEYPDPVDAAMEHGVPVDHPAVLRMRAALAKLTEIAAKE